MKIKNKYNFFYNFLKHRKRDSSGMPPLTNKQGKTIEDTKGKAEALNEQYQSVFNKENNQSIPPVNNQNLNMPDINFTTNGISKLLSKLNIQKANGPDIIPIRFLKDYTDDIANFLKIIFQNYYNTGDLPQDWLTADIIPIFKKGKKKASFQLQTCVPYSHHLQTNGTHHTHTHNSTL